MKCVVVGVIAFALAGCGKKDDKAGGPFGDKPGDKPAENGGDKDAMVAKARQLVKTPPTGEAKPLPAGVATRDDTIILSSDPAQTDAIIPAQVTYALILNPIEQIAPQLKDGSNFVQGIQVVEARLYDIAGNKYLGGAVVHAESSPSVGSKGADQKAIDDDLNMNVKTAIDNTLKNGNPQIASPPDWKRITSRGISASVPPAYQLLAYKSSVPSRILSFVADHDTDAKETLDFFHEPSNTKFATDSDCAARVAGYASELSATVTSAKVEDGMCVGDLDKGGKRRTRVRYWEQYGDVYSEECEGPSAKVGFTQQCDIMWASHALK